MTAVDAFVCIRVINAPRIRLAAGASAACVWIGAGAPVSKVESIKALAIGFGNERGTIRLLAVSGKAARPGGASGVVG